MVPLPRELLQELLGCAPPAHNARHPPTAAAAATIPGAAGRVGEGAASAGQSAAGVVGAVKGRGGDRQGLLQALHTQAGGTAGAGTCTAHASQGEQQAQAHALHTQARGTAGAGTCTAHASQGHSRRRLMHCTRKPGEQQGRTIRLNRGEQQAQRARRRNTHDKAHLGGGAKRCGRAHESTGVRCHTSPRSNANAEGTAVHPREDTRRRTPTHTRKQCT